MKKKTRKTQNAIHVAAVVSSTVSVADITGFPFVRSKRPDGDWACFISTDRADAIYRALQAVRNWGGGSNRYRVLLGTLTTVVATPTNYKLVPLGGKAK